jgi:LacI family transcriptional regulator
MKDVANLSGFSISTISHVINNTRFVEEETKEKILQAIKKLNYKPNPFAQSLKGKGMSTIGVIISDISEEYFANAIKAIEEKAYLSGFNVMLCDSEEDSKKERAQIESLIRKNVDGIIIVPADSEMPYNTYIDPQTPIVQMDRKAEHLSADFVGIDNFECSKTATKRMLEMGCKSLAFIGYKSSVFTMKERRAGYLAAMKDAGIDNDSSVLLLNPQSDDSEGAISAWLSECKGFDSIMCGNDKVCYDTLSALSKGESCDFSKITLFSFNNSRWFKFLQYPVFAVIQPASEIGVIALDLLLHRIKGTGPEYPEEIFLKPGYIFRNQ